MSTSTVLLADITVAHAIYSSTVLVVVFVVALAVRFVVSCLKKRLRRRAVTNLVAQMLDDVEESLFILLLLTGLYLALLGLPPVANYEMVLRRGFTILSTILVVYALLRVQSHALTWYVRSLGRGRAQTKVLATMLPMAKRTIGIVVLAMAVLVILDQLGVAIAPLVAGLGIAGLAVALALQGTLTNFFAGINVLTDGSIRVGDYVELESGLAGYIDQIGWRTTRIRMLANNMIIIPNSKLADSVATNYNFPVEELSVYVSVGVAYSSDLDHVERVTVDVANQVSQETSGSVEGYQPSIWYTDFADSNINFWVVLRAYGYLDMWALKHNFIKALLHRYNEEGIEISFPARSLYLKDSAGPIQPLGVHKATSRKTGSRRPSGGTAKSTALHQEMASDQGDGDLGGGE